MEADERYRFTLDGQLATLDDYLEVRPEAAERVLRDDVVVARAALDDISAPDNSYPERNPAQP